MSTAEGVPDENFVLSFLHNFSSGYGLAWETQHDSKVRNDYSHNLEKDNTKYFFENILTV